MPKKVNENLLASLGLLKEEIRALEELVREVAAASEEALPNDTYTFIRARLRHSIPGTLENIAYYVNLQQLLDNPSLVTAVASRAAELLDKADHTQKKKQK